MIITLREQSTVDLENENNNNNNKRINSYFIMLPFGLVNDYYYYYRSHIVKRMGIKHNSMLNLLTINFNIGCIYDGNKHKTILIIKVGDS